MSDHEKEMAQTIESALSKIDPADQKYLLGYAEGVLAANNAKKEDEKAEIPAD